MTALTTVNLTQGYTFPVLKYVVVFVLTIFFDLTAVDDAMVCDKVLYVSWLGLQQISKLRIAVPRDPFY